MSLAIHVLAADGSTASKVGLGGVTAARAARSVDAHRRLGEVDLAVEVPDLGVLRVRTDRRGRVERRVDDPRLRVGNAADGWQTLTRREVLSIDPDGVAWAALRELGARRPSPSGPSGPTTPEAQRGTVQVLVRLAPDAAARLRELAERRRVTLGALVTGWLDGERS